MPVTLPPCGAKVVLTTVLLPGRRILILAPWTSAMPYRAAHSLPLPGLPGPRHAGGMSRDDAMRTRDDRSLPVALWAARAAWAATAVTVAVSIGRVDGLAHATALSAAWWLAVGAVIVSLLVPGCLGLTVVRVVVPATVVPAALLLAGGVGDDTGVAAASAAGAVLAVATTALVLWSGFGEAMVQGSAYGDERRLPLRPPVAHAVAMTLTWAVWAAVVAVSATAAARDALSTAVPLAVVAAAFGFVLVRTAHRFSRRWLVLVPAGLVVHDHVLLGETLMVTRQAVDTARLAPAGSEALDLTGPASGYAIEVVVGEPVTVLLAADRRTPRGRAVHARSFLVAPSRPGRALRAAAGHRLRVG